MDHSCYTCNDDELILIDLRPLLEVKLAFIKTCSHVQSHYQVWYTYNKGTILFFILLQRNQHIKEHIFKLVSKNTRNTWPLSFDDPFIKEDKFGFSVVRWCLSLNTGYWCYLTFTCPWIKNRKDYFCCDGQAYLNGNTESKCLKRLLTLKVIFYVL